MRVVAREFATRGAEAFDRGAFAEALDDFNRAAALFDAPTIAVMQARTLVKLGRWLEGLDRYQRTARQTLSPNEPPPFHEAIRQAATEGEALRQQLPQLSLLVDPREQPQLVVELDGQVLPPSLLNTQRPIDPGTHRLKVSQGAVPFLQRTVDTPPGQHVQLRLSLPIPTRVVAKAPVAAPPEKEQVAAPKPSPASSVQESEPNWPLIGVATIGGLGAIGAGLSAAFGSATKAHLDDDCESPTRCSNQQQDDIDALQTARALFYVSSAMFVIGGSLTAYLLVAGQDDGTAQAKLSVSPFGAKLTTTF